MRGRFVTGADGIVAFHTVMPAAYPVPHDGPVGRVLAAMGRGPMRPAHVHFWIKKPGYRDLITHIFKDGDPHLDEDAADALPAIVGHHRAGQLDVHGAGLEVGAVRVVMRVTDRLAVRALRAMDQEQHQAASCLGMRNS
jgi:hypothetical protein